VAVPPAVLVGLACWTYVSSAVAEVWLQVPFVRVWLQAWSFFELSPRLAAYATPTEDDMATMTATVRRRSVRRRIVVYPVSESA
jgi:hypothetical protein